MKPEKARRLEDYLIQAARSGQLRPGSGDGGRISEDNLVDFLDRIGEQEAASTSKITVHKSGYTKKLIRIVSTTARL